METRNCQNCKNEFIIDQADFSFYEKMKVPAPTFCPDCRRQRRNAWRNSFSLYSRKCDLCEKSVVSIYAPDSGITIYCNKCWWSDKWDPKSYAQEYDFSRPFFEQYHELVKKVPHMAIVNDDDIASLNCQYTHDIWFSKNCYMCFSGWRVENVMYSFYIIGGKDYMDCMNVLSDTSFMYECFNSGRSYRLKYSQFCKQCVDSSFLYNCINCTDCFMCSGLRNQKYCFKNEQYTKEDYEKILNEYKLDTYSGVEKAKKEYDEFIIKHPRWYSYKYQNTDDCTGDLVVYSKNTKDSFMVKRMENCRYAEFSNDNKDSYDVVMSGELSECYDAVVADHSNQNFWGVFSVKSQDLKYTQHCHNCKYSFGCTQLRNDKYCILNKQYTKEEYEELLPKILKHMDEMPYVDAKGNSYKYGEFYPIEHSPFGYNETLAMEHAPLTREEALEKGYNWQDNVQCTKGRETLLPENISDKIGDVSESILNEVLKCIECERNYKIVPNEYLFYKKMNIPIPRKCFTCRHNDRLKKRNPFKLWHRKCMNEDCQNEFETSYAPDRPEVIYCDVCYKQETY